MTDLEKALAALKPLEAKFVVEFVKRNEKFAFKAYSAALGPNKRAYGGLASSSQRLLKKPEIKHALEMARNESAKTGAVTVKSHVKSLETLRDESRKGAIESTTKFWEGPGCKKKNRVRLDIFKPDMKAAVRSEELIGKASGLYVERHQMIVEQSKTPEQLAADLSADTDEAVKEVVARLIKGEPMDAQRMMAIVSRHEKEAA